MNAIKRQKLSICESFPGIVSLELEVFIKMLFYYSFILVLLGAICNIGMYNLVDKYYIVFILLIF